MYSLIVPLAVLGFVLLVAGILAGRYLVGVFQRRQLRGWWIAAELVVFVLGLSLGVQFYAFTYSYSATVKIVGFPFFAGLFELHEGLWLDFVGPLTLPACLGNFLVGLLVPHLAFAFGVSRYLKRINLSV